MTLHALENRVVELLAFGLGGFQLDTTCGHGILGIVKIRDLQAVIAESLAWRRKRLDVLNDAIEFGMINPAYLMEKSRYIWSTTTRPGWFLFNGYVRHDTETGVEQVYELPEGVYASESPMVPTKGASSEDDGYLVTFLIDENGKILKIWRKVRVKGHVEEVLETVKSLKKG